MHLKLAHEDSETVVCELWKRTCHSYVTHSAHFYKSRLSPIRASCSLHCIHSVMRCLGYSTLVKDAQAYWQKSAPFTRGMPCHSPSILTWHCGVHFAGHWAWCPTAPLFTEVFEIGFKYSLLGTSLVAQWLRLCAPNLGGPGSIPGQGTRSHMLQLRNQHAAMKMEITCATAKIWHSQINYFSK